MIFEKKAALKYFGKLKEKPVPLSLFKQSSEVYSELCQTSKMKRFAKIVDG